MGDYDPISHSCVRQLNCHSPLNKGRQAVLHKLRTNPNLASARGLHDSVVTQRLGGVQVMQSHRLTSHQNAECLQRSNLGGRIFFDVSFLISYAVNAIPPALPSIERGILIVYSRR